MRWTARSAWSASWCLVMLCVLATETAAQWSGRSYALVVGVDTYRAQKWSALGYAVKDAEGMAAFLKEQGFNVTTLYNQQATKEAIIYQLQNVFAPRLQPGDRVLVFFAGHGYTERLSGTDYGYIVPHDGKDYSATYISMEELLTLSRKMGDATHQLFIMDACYGGLLGLRGGGVDEKRPDYIAEVIRRKARQILTAGGANQQVVDNGPEGHSVFTGYLLKALREGLADRNGDGYVSFVELAEYMSTAATNMYQTPGWNNLPGHELGEFLFRVPRQAPPPSPPPPLLLREPQPRGEGLAVSTLPPPSDNRPPVARLTVLEQGQVGEEIFDAVRGEEFKELFRRLVESSREGFAGIADGAPDRNGFYTSKIAVPGSVMNIVKPRESHQTRLAYVQDRKTAELHLDFVLNRLRDAFPNIKIRPPDPNYPKYDRLLKNIVLDEGNPPVTMWLSLTTNGSEYQVEFGVYVPEPARH